MIDLEVNHAIEMQWLYIDQRKIASMPGATVTALPCLSTYLRT